MITSQFLFIVLLLLLTACNQNEDVTIRGKIVGEANPAELNIKFDPARNLDSSEINVPVDPSGKFSLNREIKKPANILVSAGNYMCFLLAQPGDQFHLTFNGSFRAMSFEDQENAPVIIKGSNAAGQFLLNRIKKNHFMALRSSYDGWDINRPETLIADLKNTVDKNLAPFRSTHQEGRIDDAFMEKINAYIGYRYAFRLTQTVLNDLYKEQRKGREITGLDPKIQILKDIFRRYPIQSEKVIYLGSEMSPYLGNYLRYREHIDKEEFERYTDSGLVKTHELAIIKKETEPEVYEKYALQRLWGSTFQGGNREDIRLYEDFAEQFPDCPYKEMLTMLEINIRNIRKMVDLSDQTFPAGTRLIDDYRNINSFEELISVFEGKNLYMDIWATWCGGCVEAIKRSSHLRQFAQSQPLELVYISLDKPGYREQWKNYIKKYQIRGHHILANEQLRQNLDSVIPNHGKIPRYLIVNNKGKIVDFDAKSPLAEEKLTQQLQNELNFKK
jgi:thiol-disulfide isomerase/thioredoxin